MRKKKDDRFDCISTKDFEKAQKIINSLCKNHGLKPWNIKSGKGKWRELCLRIGGLAPNPNEKPKKVGRPAHSEEWINEIGLSVELYDAFEDLTKPKKERKKPLVINKKIYKAVAEEKGIKEKTYQSKREPSKPENIVKGLHERYRRIDKQYKGNYQGDC
jgi:hypothetical protein